MELLLMDQNHILVRIKLSERDDEQNIFDTVNNSGKKLNTADIIKNKLFKKALELSKSEKTVYDLYDNDWETIFYKDEDYFKFWNEERQTGRLRRTNLEILFYCVAIIKGMYTPSVDNLEKLDVPYKKKLNQFTSYEEIEEFIKAIICYAKSYIALFKDIENNGIYNKQSNDYVLKRLLLILKELEISTFSPFVLETYSSKSLSSEQKNERYASLEKTLIKNLLCGETTKNYNMICAELLKKPENYNSLLNNSAKYNKFDEDNSLHKLKNKRATLILFFIELERNNKQHDIQTFEYVYSLEHIMPKNWQTFWSIDQVEPVDSYGNITTDRLTAENNRKYEINSLGNMTLITKQFNSALKNSSFEIKMNGNGKHKGYKDCSSLMITKDIINDYLTKKKTVWNEQSIILRLDNLIKDIKKIWF